MQHEKLKEAVRGDGVLQIGVKGVQHAAHGHDCGLPCRHS